MGFFILLAVGAFLAKAKCCRRRGEEQEGGLSGKQDIREIES